MCLYITPFLPACKTEDLAVLTGIAVKHHRRLDSLDNADVEALLKPGERYFYTTKGSCDCGSLLGSMAHDDPPELGADYFQRQLDRLRAKGWTEAKIARWQNSRAQNRQRKEEASRIFDPHCNDDWYAFLSEMLGTKLVKYVGLLLHFYSSGLSGRIRNLTRQAESIRLREAGVECLAYLRKDVMYEFR